MKLAVALFLGVAVLVAAPRSPASKEEKRRAIKASGIKFKKPIRKSDMDLNGDGRVTKEEQEKWFRINRMIKSFK